MAQPSAQKSTKELHHIQKYLFCIFFRSSSCSGCCLRLALLLRSLVCLGDGGLNLLHCIRLDDVALLKITEVDDGDAALVSSSDLLHLILEASQRVKLPIEELNIVTQDADLRVVVDLALEDIRTRDKGL